MIQLTLLLSFFCLQADCYFKNLNKGLVTISLQFVIAVMEVGPSKTSLETHRNLILRRSDIEYLSMLMHNIDKATPPVN